MRQPKILKIIEETLTEHKAENISVFNVKERTPFNDYAVVVEAPNERAIESWGEYLIEALEKNGFKVRAKEGNSSSKWVIIDAGVAIIHLLDSKEKERINFDDLYGKF